MNTKRSRIDLNLLMLLFIVISSVVNAQITSNEIDSLVEVNIKKLNIAGISVGVVKDGKIIHARGYGVSSIKSNTKVDKNTSFGIGSNTKAFTTAALSILVDEGKLNWSDKVQKHIPEFTMYDAYVAHHFTVEDLLCHRSGLGLGIGDLMLFPSGSDFTTADILAAFQYFEPTSEFRTKFDYDNLLYIVAGEVVARVSGMSWEVFVQERILNQLGMVHSFSNLSELYSRENVSASHSDESKELEVIPPYTFDVDKINGALGSIYSSAYDMSLWMLMQLNNGKYNDDLSQSLFSKNRQREMWKIHTLTNTSRNPRYNSHFAGYGLGWFLTDVNGNMIVSHTGGMPGMLSKVVMIPDMDLGVVVLTNTSNNGAYAFMSITQTIIDSYLDVPEKDWTTYFSDYMQKKGTIADSVTLNVWEKVASNSKLELINSDYIGVYKDKWFGEVEVYMNGDQLWFKSLRSPKLNGPLAYYNANTFAIRWEYRDMEADAFAMFVLNEKGQAVGIKMKGISPNIDFSYDFHDLDFIRVD